MPLFDLVYPVEPAPMYPQRSVDAPGAQHSRTSVSELLPLVKPSGLVYGRAQRAWCHNSEEGRKHLHPIVHLQLLDPLGRFYLQKRSADRPLWPGLWDGAVGGHVTYGEQILEALFREAAEEIGLVNFTPVFVDTHIFEERELIATFALVGHPDLHPSNAEVTEGRWWTQEEIEAGRDRLTPGFLTEYALLRDALLALI